MRNYLLIFLLILGHSVNAQSNKTLKALAGSRLLVKTIFETKDSVTLESLFAPGMKHRNYNGKIESRDEAIRNIANNRSVFVQADMTLGGYGVTPAKDSTIVKYFYKGREKKPDGTSAAYTVNLVMVWEKGKKDMKLIRLETLKID
jgi:hypothetical protein